MWHEHWQNLISFHKRKWKNVIVVVSELEIHAEKKLLGQLIILLIQKIV